MFLCLLESPVLLSFKMKILGVQFCLRYVLVFNLFELQITMDLKLFFNKDGWDLALNAKS